MNLPSNEHISAQEQMEALTGHLAEVKAANIKECRAIDKSHDYSFAPKSGKRDKLTSKELRARDTKTIHDYLAENPGLRALYKSGGFEKLLGL